jgi:hypothetical protein
MPGRRVTLINELSKAPRLRQEGSSKVAHVIIEMQVPDLVPIAVRKNHKGGLSQARSGPNTMQERVLNRDACCCSLRTASDSPTVEVRCIDFRNWRNFD